MDLVLFFQSTTRKSRRLKLTGAYRFAREHDWFVQVIDAGAKAGDVRRLLARLFKSRFGQTIRAWQKSR